MGCMLFDSSWDSNPDQFFAEQKLLSWEKKSVKEGQEIVWVGTMVMMIEYCRGVNHHHCFGSILGLLSCWFLWYFWYQKPLEAESEGSRAILSKVFSLECCWQFPEQSTMWKGVGWWAPLASMAIMVSRRINGDTMAFCIEFCNRVILMLANYILFKLWSLPTSGVGTQPPRHIHKQSLATRLPWRGVVLINIWPARYIINSMN